jgi:hypothetical protein
MHVVLILTFVLGAQPKNIEHPLTSMGECLSGIGVQSDAAQWLASHPNYTFVGWKCQISNRVELKA